MSSTTAPSVVTVRSLDFVCFGVHPAGTPVLAGFGNPLTRGVGVDALVVMVGVTGTDCVVEIDGLLDVGISTGRGAVVVGAVVVELVTVDIL